MAVNREKLFDGIENGAAWDAGVVFNRTNGIPLDKWSVFKTYEDAILYASSNPVAYAGQIITVVSENGSSVAYIIEESGTLKEIGSDIEVTIETDTTLSQEGKAADAKATGERIEELKSQIVVPITQEEYDELLVSGKVISTVYYYIYEDVTET